MASGLFNFRWKYCVATKAYDGCPSPDKVNSLNVVILESGPLMVERFLLRVSLGAPYYMVKDQVF
jgi:hypothetical protein